MTDRPSGGRTDNDQIKPFHAKEVTTGQEAADVVKAVIEHAAAREAAAKRLACLEAPEPSRLSIDHPGKRDACPTSEVAALHASA